MYECFHCGCKSVIWDADFTPEEMGYGGEGVVNVCHCENCGAIIHYIVLEEEKE